MHLHSIVKEVPVLRAQEVEELVHVPEVHWMEDVRFTHEKVVKEEACLDSSQVPHLPW